MATRSIDPADDVTEGAALINGSRLAYRLVGRPSQLPTLVFENALAASYQQWHWIEKELAPFAQLLFYDRAGVGASESSTTHTVERFCDDLCTLLSTLKINTPVILVGHSFGGLLSVLHASRYPEAVKAVAMLDATPVQSDPRLDGPVALMTPILLFSIALAALGLPNPLLTSPPGLPDFERERIETLCFRSARSLRGSLGEVRLLGSVRAAIASSTHDLSHQRRLVISAGKVPELTSTLLRTLGKTLKVHESTARMQKLHKEFAHHGSLGQWEKLAQHSHGSIVATAEGSAQVAKLLLNYLNSF